MQAVARLEFPQQGLGNAHLHHADIGHDQSLRPQGVQPGFDPIGTELDQRRDAGIAFRAHYPAKHVALPGRQLQPFGQTGFNHLQALAVYLIRCKSIFLNQRHSVESASAKAGQLELTDKKKPLGSTSPRGWKGLEFDWRRALPLYAEAVQTRPEPFPLAQLRSWLPRQVSWLVDRPLHRYLPTRLRRQWRYHWSTPHSQVAQPRRTYTAFPIKSQRFLGTIFCC